MFELNQAGRRQRLLQRRWPVRVVLVGLAIVLVLPGLLFGGILLTRFAEAERTDYRADALATTARVADSVDRELAILVAATSVLAASSALGTENVAAFGKEALAVVGVLGQQVVLVAPDGNALFDSSGQSGRFMHEPAAARAVHQVVAEQRPFVSNLFMNASGEARITVMAPVERSGKVVFVVGIVLSPAYFTAVLQSQALPGGWIASLRDSEGRLFARTQNVDRFLGETLFSGEHARPIGGTPAWRTTTLDGIPVLAAATRTRVADWRVSIGAPLIDIEAPIRLSVRVLGMSFLFSLLLGCAIAGQLARSVSRVLVRLAEAGRALGAGGEVLPVRSRIREVEAVSHALVGASIDLHARGDALAAERAQLAAIIETVPVGIMIAQAPSGQIVARNRELARMLRLGSDPSDAGSVACYDDAAEPVPRAAMPLFRALAGEDPAELRCRHRRGDGSLFWVKSVAAPIRTGDGVITGAVMALLDIDEVVRAREQKTRWAERLEEEVAARTAELAQTNHRLRAEIAARNDAVDQLRQSQKMEAVGRLTGGIAHDFNNLLTLIVGSLDLLRRRKLDLRSMQLIANAQDGANRAADLIARLLAFSRRQPLLPQPVDVNRLVADTSVLLRRTLGETIRIETSLAENLWTALADPNQLENALLNLAVNARDAILQASPGGGRLVIETANVSLNRLNADWAPDGKPGDYVIIATRDNGPGMSPELVSRVFEPFFTTKPVGQGTGLGLSQVHGFTVQSGGHVEIDTAVGHGTTVKLYLPRVREAESVQAASKPPPDLQCSPGGALILLVEDEDGVRGFAGEALRGLGYQVLEADRGALALDVLDANPQTALLMSDLVMPGMSGRELAEIVAKRRPELPILFITGYSFDRNEAADHRPVLLKPFTVADLARHVRAALA